MREGSDHRAPSTHSPTAQHPSQLGALVAPVRGQPERVRVIVGLSSSTAATRHVCAFRRGFVVTVSGKADLGSRLTKLVALPDRRVVCRSTG